MSLFMVCQTWVNESEAPATTFILNPGRLGSGLASVAVLFVFRAPDAEEQEGESRSAPPALRRESDRRPQPADLDSGSPPTFDIEN